MTVWVVWEANATPPEIFTSQTYAYTYRTRRAAQVRHQVYIKEIELDE